MALLIDILQSDVEKVPPYFPVQLLLFRMYKVAKTTANKSLVDDTWK